VDGEGMVRALRRALTDGGLTPRDVVHVNAHATSTPQGDLAESTALRTVLGCDGYCVSATKSMTGHLMGAAGAVEAVITALTVRDRVAPPTIGVTQLDPRIGLDIVLDACRPLAADPVVALSNSCGFGGHNVVLAFRSS
ncbi:MAG TPA: beta-ketoacyl-ACP synthase, partial [Rugosimonospora sp.]|nr:beta-ketoacyl-ACP synthase [Rugosimonospora sp.]